MAAGEEGSPLLPKKEEKTVEKPAKKTEDFVPEQREQAAPGWTVDGLPLGHGNVVGAPVSRSQWDSSLFACLGRNDEFCSSDLEVCLLGTVAPCMLYGSNVERLSLAPGTFANHCLPYTSLYLLGNFLFGWNCLAPWFSYPSRPSIRRKFNLEGSCEAFSRSCGCCQGLMEDDEQREQCESSCDFATHFFCHRCALCQEGRELRRRLPHPGFNGRSVLVMLPPMEQMMGREA
uniref:Cell number regulator 8-like n=1 Tax=Araucaria cunninghamii TaxID=56994 RepID=A0A0D6QW93_ARACU